MAQVTGVVTCVGFTFSLRVVFVIAKEVPNLRRLRGCQRERVRASRWD